MFLKKKKQMEGIFLAFGASRFWIGPRNAIRAALFRSDVSSDSCQLPRRKWKAPHSLDWSPVVWWFRVVSRYKN